MKGLCGNCCEQWADKTCYNYDWKWMTIDLCEDCYDCREIWEEEERDAKVRLEYLRKQIENECISTWEIVELQWLVDYIEKNDVLLLERAWVPENV